MIISRNTVSSTNSTSIIGVTFAGDHGISTRHQMSRHSPAVILRHNEFYGRRRQQVDVSGFALAHLRLDPTANVQRHTHDTAHFVLLLRGAYLTTAKGAPSLCTRPTLIYNPPGTTHRDRFDLTRQPNDGRFFSLSISADRMATIVDHAPLLDAPTCLTAPRAIALATRLANECRAWDPASPLVAEGISLDLVAHVARTALGAPPSHAPPPWRRRAREMIRDQCADDLSVAQIAQAVGVHPVYLARAFRRFFARSPGDELRHHRLARAAALLRDTTHPLSAVAHASGFADQSHLAKTFRRAYAMTPGAYRRLMTGRDVPS
jgi:AraC family transcriptional regulator